MRTGKQSQFQKPFWPDTGRNSDNNAVGIQFCNWASKTFEYHMALKNTTKNGKSNTTWCWYNCNMLLDAQMVLFAHVWLCCEVSCIVHHFTSFYRTVWPTWNVKCEQQLGIATKLIGNKQTNKQRNKINEVNKQTVNQFSTTIWNQSLKRS